MLIDNKEDRYTAERGNDDHLNIVTVWDFIDHYSGKDAKYSPTGKLDIVTGYFTIEALSALYEHIPAENDYRIISSEMTGSDSHKDCIANLLSDELDINFMGNLDKHAKQAIAFLERDTVEMRAQVPEFCHAKAYAFKNNESDLSSYYVIGSSNLTPSGIGINRRSPNIELNTAEAFTGHNNDFSELQKWYDEIWKAAKTHMLSNQDDENSKKIPVKDYFIQKIKEYFRTYSPAEIYYKILFEMFNSDMDLDGGIEHQKDMGLLQTSAIWHKLYDYQKKGVISLIKMLRKYNGAILADAVGLGKTYSALAVMKYFQTQSYTTVLLCPKKLEQNWTQYQRGAGSRFEKDEFDYVVRFHTDCQNLRLEKSYQTYKLDYLQTRKKVLVVIDESHNLRNEKSGRYIELLNRLIKNREGQDGRDVKVLMLSATPINTGLKDVKGQFNLIAHGDDSAFNNDDFGVESLTNIFKDAQTKYTQWCGNPDRTIGGFIHMLDNTNFFNLTDKLIVARTRKLIETNLDKGLGFPEKDRPINIYQGVDHFGKYRSTEEIYKAFESLQLTAYQPSLFLHESRKDARKEASKDWDDDVNRERFLVKMMCILFLKRLESSWFSCMSTVKKVYDVHKDTLDKVVDYKENGVDSVIRRGEILDEDDDYFEEAQVGRPQIKVSNIVNLGGFEAGLRHDVNQLKAIYESLQDFERKYRAEQESDLKLEELIKILNAKKNAENKKVIVFTAYSDTAQFLYDELTKRGFTKVASASGVEVNSTGRHSKKNFTEVLQSFAPYSKLYKELDWDSLYEEAGVDRAKCYDDECHSWNVPYESWKVHAQVYRPNIARLLNDEIDILIATDCLSEGQNLQDADMQVNYDIHWNPVRLIQRFGRIDRIGSPNKRISCVNFWPAKSFEDYLHLETRIQNRMSMMTLVGSETQELNDEYLKMVEDNPLNDKNANRLLQELQNNSISDIESPQTLSLKDFSFETYRQDLSDYYQQQNDFYRKMPNGVFSGFVNKTEQFENILDSLVALVGYPKKPAGHKPYQYKELYLMCQPIDTDLPATYREINKADILEFLRQNKDNERFVPEWVVGQDDERISRLSEVLKTWMKQKAPQQAVRNIKDKLKRHSISTAKENRNQMLQEEKFQIENFDLIVWEYVTKKSE